MNIGVIGLGSMGKRRIRLLKNLEQCGSIIGIDSREDRRIEAEEAFKTVGIVVRAKIERLCNERRYEEAKELEKALITINNADYNH